MGSSSATSAPQSTAPRRRPCRRRRALRRSREDAAMTRRPSCRAAVRAGAAVHSLVERRQARAQVRDAIHATLEEIRRRLLQAELRLEAGDELVLRRELELELLGFGYRFCAQATELARMGAERLEVGANLRGILLLRRGARSSGVRSDATFGPTPPGSKRGVSCGPPTGPARGAAGRGLRASPRVAPAPVASARRVLSRARRRVCRAWLLAAVSSPIATLPCSTSAVSAVDAFVAALDAALERLDVALTVDGLFRG